jgi:hypothetical protein
MNVLTINGYPALMRDLKWSATEKSIAKKTFNLALQRELEAVMKKARAMAAKLEQPVDLWKLENYLTRRRQRIDRQYDYRYSVLPQVFADLIRKGRLREQDLQGLGDDQLEYVRRYATT